MSDPISVTVNESGVIASTTITVSQANISANGSVSVTVANSAIASGAGKTIVSAGGIADLTSAQQLEVGEGTIVVTADGYRYIYSGAGSKTSPASYVILADMTPDWATLTGKPSTFPPSGHASSHGAAGADPITVAASQISGGALPANATLDFSDGTNDSEVGGWGFGVELAADSSVYATVTPAQVQVGNADGVATLTPGTLAMPNGTSVAVGTFDNGLSGNNGISINCAVGYELNWQAGHLRCTADGGATTATILVDSPLEFPVPSGSTPGADNVQIDYVGVTFADGSMQTTAAIPLPESPADGDVLQWSATASAWVAASSGIPASAVMVADLGLSFGTDDNLSVVIENISAALDGKASSVHSHAASDITSGTLDIARIPTGTSGTTVCIGNDSRLSDARTPTAHSHVITDVTGLATVLNAKANLSSPTFTGTVSGITKSMVGLGNVPNTDATQRSNHTGTQTLSTISDAGTAAGLNVPATGDATSTQVVIGSDTRLTNSRTPTAHKASHATGGSDALTAADIGAAASSHTHAASDITSGTIATARLGSGTASSSTFLRGDQTYAAPPVQSVDGLTGTVSVAKSDTFEFTRSTYPASATVASTGSYVWSIPAGAKTIEVLAIGGGGGGGSGRLGAAGSARSGGGGGAGGAIIRWMGAVSDSNSSTLYVVVGAGGGGGAAVSASDTNGNSGSAGNITRVVTGSAGAQSGIIADGGAGGGGGATTSGSGGGETAWQTTTMFQGGGGATGRNTAGDAAGAYRTAGTAGGGGGGGLDTANANYAGGTGGSACTRVIGDAIFYRGAAGTAGGGNGGNATSGGALFALFGIGGGGGGGNASGAGGTGGNGSRGGGGGGGGAAVNGSTSGAGGNGGDGYVRITVWY